MAKARRAVLAASRVTVDADAKGKAVPLRFSVPLEQVPPGRYDCQVTVLLPGGGEHR